MGLWGENKAVEFLKAKNYTILARNYHSRFGEIDIIARKQNTIIFVEVKTRKILHLDFLLNLWIIKNNKNHENGSIIYK